MLVAVCDLCCIPKGGEQQPCTWGQPTHPLPSIWGPLEISWGRSQRLGILDTATNFAGNWLGL